MNYPGFDIKPVNEKIDQIYAFIHSDNAGLNRFGFRRGYLGIAVFCYLYGLHTHQKTYFRQSSKYFDLACQTINIDPAVSYPLDFSDLGIVSQYLVGAGVLDLTPNIFLEDVDKFLGKKMRFELGQNNLAGFSTGAAGYALYFLHRATYDPLQSAVMLSEFISAIRRDQLHYTVQVDRGLATENPDLLRELNLSEGICSVILLLSKLAESGWAADTDIVEIIDNLSHFVIWKYEMLNSPAKSVCFQDGDLGIGYALLRAGKVFNRCLCFEKGGQILEECANIFLLKNKPLPDTSMLGGTSGAALVFEKVYHLAGQDLFSHAADCCYKYTLDGDVSGEGIMQPMQPDLSFIEGITGTGAGLIKAISRDRIDFGELLWLI
jgi:hypothetical protein